MTTYDILSAASGKISTFLRRKASLFSPATSLIPLRRDTDLALERA
jgi:hypothetical protein